MIIRIPCIVAIGILSSAWLGYNDANAAALRARVCDQSQCRAEPGSRPIRIKAWHGRRRDNEATFWARISADLNCCEPPTWRFYGYTYGPDMSVSFYPALSAPRLFAR